MTSGEQLPSKRGLTSGRPTDYKTNANFAICTELLYDEYVLYERRVQIKSTPNNWDKTGMIMCAVNCIIVYIFQDKYDM